MLDAGADADRRPDAGAHGGHRRARAAVRRRHLHAHRLRVAGRRGQPRGASASTTRARTSGPSATRSGAAWSRSSRGRSPTRSSTPRRSAASCRRCSPACAPTRLPALARALGLDEARFMQTVTRLQRRLPRRARFDHTALDDCRTEGLAPAKTHWARPHRHAAVLRLCAAARRHLHLPRPEGRRSAPRVHFGGAPSDNLFVAGEMMAGNVLGKGYTAGVGMTHRHRVRPHRRHAGRGRAAHARRPRMQSLEALTREAAALSRRRCARPTTPRRGRARAADLQRLPLLRRLLRGVPGDDAPARVRAGRRALPGQPVPQLRRLPARLPVRAAARVRRQRAARDGAGARADLRRTTPGRARSARCTGATA